MEQLHTEQELQETEVRTWAAWRDHFTACGQCLRADDNRAILSRGCTKGRAFWCNWNVAFKAYSATQNKQRRTA